MEGRWLSGTVPPRAVDLNALVFHYRWRKTLTREDLITKATGKGFCSFIDGIKFCVRALSPQDPRFNAEVDLITGYKTQSILCLPIKNHRDEVRLHSLERWILCRVGKLAFDDLQWI